MKQFQIEETIIAYFDGRLSDHESAELLHRVSISPEIRQLFREHEMLRQMAERAARNVSVRPDVEDALFAKIASMAPQEVDEEAALVPLADQATAPATRVTPVRGWTIRKWTSVAALLGLLAGAAIWNSIGGDHSTSVGIASQGVAGSLANNNSAVKSSDSNPAATSTVSSAIKSEVTGSATLSNTGNNSTVDGREGGAYRRNPVPTQLRNSLHSPVSNDRTGETPGNLSDDLTKNSDQGVSEISPLGQSSIGGPDGFTQPLRLGLIDRHLDESTYRFEFGVGTFSGALVMPANAPGSTVFSDYQVHLAYQVGANDQVGLRFTSGQFQTLSSNIVSNGVFTTISRSNVLERRLAEEVYYLHRIEIADGRYFVDGGIGIGLLDGQSNLLKTEGNMVSAEVGFKIPYGEHLLGGVSFMLSRVHLNADTREDLMSKQTLPVIFSDDAGNAGSDIHNTLNGRFEFGLSYRF